MASNKYNYGGWKRYEEYKIPIQFHQLKTMKVKKIMDRAENFLLSLKLNEIISLRKLEIFTGAGPPGLYMAWDKDKVCIHHLSVNFGNRYWRKHILDNKSLYTEPATYDPSGLEITYEMSFDFIECQSFACPFRFVPIYINHDYKHIKAIMSWRLQLGR